MQAERRRSHVHADFRGQHLEAWEEEDGSCRWSVIETKTNASVGAGTSTELFQAMATASVTAGHLENTLVWRGVAPDQ
jgi:hypothetical protein